MKTILGLDLGTNSIGWAKVIVDDNENYLRDIQLGSRIIPMSQDVLGKFDKGVTESQTAIRTNFRGIRRLRERTLQRRERLHRVLHSCITYLLTMTQPLDGTGKRPLPMVNF